MQHILTTVQPPSWKTYIVLDLTITDVLRCSKVAVTCRGTSHGPDDATSLYGVVILLEQEGSAISACDAAFSISTSTWPAGLATCSMYFVIDLLDYYFMEIPHMYTALVPFRCDIMLTVAL
jgi:hypothetical protein